MKKSNLIGVLLAGLLLAAGAAFAEKQTIAYPTADDPSFYIDVPGDWELTQAEDVGEYFDLEGPTGATFSFRTLKARTEKQAEKALEKAIEESIEYLEENYSDVELGDPQDDTLDGCEGFYATGTGTDEDDNEVVYGMGWYVLPDATIAEVWFVTTKDDEAGLKQAEKILRSFSVPDEE